MSLLLNMFAIDAFRLRNAMLSDDNELLNRACQSPVAEFYAAYDFNYAITTADAIATLIHGRPWIKGDRAPYTAGLVCIMAALANPLTDPANLVIENRRAVSQMEEELMECLQQSYDIDGSWIEWFRYRNREKIAPLLGFPELDFSYIGMGWIGQADIAELLGHLEVLDAKVLEGQAHDRLRELRAILRHCQKEGLQLFSYAND